MRYLVRLRLGYNTAGMHASVKTAVTPSTAGKVHQTPRTPNSAANANSSGGMAAIPRSREMENPQPVCPEALKKAAAMTFSPAHQKPVKYRRRPSIA